MDFPPKMSFLSYGDDHMFHLLFLKLKLFVQFHACVQCAVIMITWWPSRDPLPLLVTPCSSPLLPLTSHLFCARKCSCPVIMVVTARSYLEDSILQCSPLFSTLTVFPPTLWCSLGPEGDYKDVLLRAECSTVTYAQHLDQFWLPPATKRSISGQVWEQH